MVILLSSISYLLSEFVEFSHTPPLSSLAESCWSGSPEGRQAYCSDLPSFSTSAELASHNKAGSSLCLVAGCFYPGRASEKRAVITGMSVGVVAELPSLKPKLEGSRHKQLGCLLKATSFQGTVSCIQERKCNSQTRYLVLKESL